jgi:hypothetical protein
MMGRTPLRNATLIKLPACLMMLIIFIGIPNSARADDESTDEIPTRYGIAAVLGNTFDPDDEIYFVQLSGFVMWDYDKVWPHRAPDPLRFRVEGTVGATTSPKTRAMVSVGMMALYYLEFLDSPRFNPYLEGGIGVIYTDFQVDGQGSRFNFNPQIGMGTEIKVESGPPFFSAVRLSHISNAGLHDDNRGVNSVIILLGRFF